MEIKINKEVREYSEKVLFGLTGRQFILACAAIVCSTVLFFILPIQTDLKLIVCVVASSPFIILGFAKVQGHTVEEYLKRRRDRAQTPALKIGEENIYFKTYRRYHFDKRYREAQTGKLFQKSNRKKGSEVLH